MDGGRRRLAAIMFTDMVGFTATAQSDERRALALVTELEQLLRPLIARSQGRVIKSLGDGLLVEFESALRATECAVEMQRLIHERNSQGGVVPVRMRVGIHVGEVEQRNGDIFGDAVNIASRLDPLADPGGVCVSAPVLDQIRNKFPHSFEKLPPTALKHVRTPLDIYRVVLPWSRPEDRSEPSGRSRLAVLPFANISPDPSDAYFADGLTEELNTVLSQLPELRVIARTSVIGYKTQPKAVAQIGAELDVTSLLEGTVRKFGDRLRVTVQLVDVRTQEHAWAHSYDRKLGDVFAVQAEIAREVASALKVKLGPTERERLAERRPVRSDSYLAFLKGRALMSERSEASLRGAKSAFESAISLDPLNAAAYAGLSDAIRMLGTRYREQPLAEWDEASQTLATRALELDPNLAEAHTSLAFSLWSDYQYAEAEDHFKKAIALNPSYSTARHWYASLLTDEGRLEEAEAQIILAREADPRSPIVVSHHAELLEYLGRFDEARGAIETVHALDPSGTLYHASRMTHLVARSDLVGALNELDHLEGTEPRNTGYRAARAAIYAALGQVERARDLLRELEGLPGDQRPSSGIAETYALLQEPDTCFRWLERAAFETFDLDVGYWRYHPRLEPIRRDPRFQDLLHRVNLR